MKPFYSLKDGKRETIWEEFEANLKMLETNISRLKKWGDQGSNAPLYITFSHHFWNLFAGHASSIDNPFLNQKEGRDTDISGLGRLVIEQLLKRIPDGRRILIDVKHLSRSSRASFYSIVRDFQSKNDQIPMIASHAAVTGISKNSHKPHPFFNSSDINLFNEDIVEICNSNGLIGIMMEEGRLVDKTVMKLVKKSSGPHSEQLKAFYAVAVLANILHIVDIAGEKAWDCVCIGSDFDGMINSLDTFDSVATYPSLFKALHEILSSGNPILFPSGGSDDVYAATEKLYSSEKIKDLMYGQHVDLIIEKLAYANTERFLQSYFTESYLKSTLIIA